MHIVITGASSGIGEAIARELGRMPGAKLTLVARRRELLEKLAKEIAIGRQGELYTEVTGGVKDGEQVVTFGSFFIDAEEKLKK